jgi:hypothetical protein
LLAWLEWTAHELRLGENFELVQAVLRRLVHVHGDALRARAELRAALGAVRDLQRGAWTGVSEALQRASCDVAFYLDGSAGGGGR